MSKTQEKLITILLLAAAAAGLFCTQDIAGGNSSETTDAVAYVYTSQGRPAQGVRYSFTRRESWFEKLTSLEPRVLKSGYVDAEGKIAFSPRNVRDCNIQLDGETEGAFVDKALSPGEADTVHLEALRKVEGTVSDASVEKLYLSGTSYETEVVEGRFCFDKLPRGHFQVFARVNGNYHTGSSLDPDSTSQNIRVRTDRVIYDDFDDGDHYPNVMNALEGSSWFWSTKDHSRLLQPTSDENFKQAIVAGQKGYALQTRFETTTETDEPYAQVSSYLSRTKMLDLSSLDSIIIHVRGNSSLILALERIAEDGSALKVGYTIEAPDTWTRFAVDPGNFHENPYDPTMRSWNELKHEVNMITVFAFGGSEFAIDGIELVGVNLQELTGK
ncbi:MAG: hypothetical protein ACLFQB_14295 [Chitinispirillaceae bacterium]